MPFVSSTYTDYIGLDKRAELYRTHARLGYHPETHDDLLVSTSDRYAGLYILGVQGSGKTGLLENLIAADIQAGHAVIVIDPHGDLTQACVSQVPESRVGDTYLLDMEDEAYPFGANVFSTDKLTKSLDHTQAIERLLHLFEVLWPEVLSQQHLPRYLRMATLVFLDNPGTTLVDMYAFLLDDGLRARMLQNATDPTVRQFWQAQYTNLSPADRLRRVQPLIGRLETLFMGRSLVRNIVGQRQTTINFRKAIEARQIVFIKLPSKTVPQDARLIGTILLAQIHAAVFSFANLPESKRPGVSLYVDEFQHFATPDFSELLTEGRKFGARVTVAHQYRNQLPVFLQGSTMTARTKVCFQTTPEDSREMAHLFPSMDATVPPEGIEAHPVRHLLTYTPEEWHSKVFTETYLRPLQSQKRGNRVEIMDTGASVWDMVNGGRGPNPRFADPTPYLDSLLYQVMRTGDPSVPIPPEAVRGFANCGRGFYKQSIGLSHRAPLLSPQVRFPPALVVKTASGTLRWTRRPEDGTEQLFHFVFHLRMVMQRLAENPIGKATTPSPTDIGKMLTGLPRRAAFVRAGNDVGVIYTHDTPKPVPNSVLHERAKAILMQTRATYCHPRAEVERLFIPAHAHSAAPVQPVSRWEEVE